MATKAEDPNYRYIAAGVGVFLDDEDDVLSPEERKLTRALRRHARNLLKAAEELKILRKTAAPKKEDGIIILNLKLDEEDFDFAFQTVVYTHNALEALIRQIPYSNPADPRSRAE